ncbi:MAG: (2Fe-2S)-binding protein [Desulfobacterales bacterium]
MMVAVNLKVNHKDYRLEIDSRATLLEILREELAFQSVHRSCEEGECGACTVLLNGEPVNSCLMLAAAADGAEIITTEGLVRDGKRHPLMDAFVDLHGMQCGYCTPGMLMTAYALIENTAEQVLTDAQIRKGIEGNLCRCTGYVNIVKAIQEAKKQRDAGNWW